MALEVAWIAVAALLGLIVLSLAINSAWVARLAPIPIVGPVLGSVRTALGMVVR